MRQSVMTTPDVVQNQHTFLPIAADGQFFSGESPRTTAWETAPMLDVVAA
jgi:hypothetical protein